MSELNWINFVFKVFLTIPAPANTLHTTHEILTLQAPISQNGQTHSNNSSANCRRIV